TSLSLAFNRASHHFCFIFSLFSNVWSPYKWRHFSKTSNGFVSYPVSPPIPTPRRGLSPAKGPVKKVLSHVLSMQSISFSEYDLSPSDGKIFILPHKLNIFFETKTQFWTHYIQKMEYSFASSINRTRNGKD
ncbi:MAG: hypothetical protein P8165_01770, partial [Deltaproteobacteria bacterium]